VSLLTTSSECLISPHFTEGQDIESIRHCAHLSWPWQLRITENVSSILESAMGSPVLQPILLHSIVGSFHSQMSPQPWKSCRDDAGSCCRETQSCRDTVNT
jgi:hypothetical protein